MFSTKIPNTENLFEHYLCVKEQLTQTRAQEFHTIDIITMFALIFSFARSAQALPTQLVNEHTFTLNLLLLLATTLPFLKHDREIVDLKKNDQDTYFLLIKRLVLLAESDTLAPEDKTKLTNSITQLVSGRRILKQRRITEVLHVISDIEPIIINADGPRHAFHHTAVDDVEALITPSRVL